MAKQTSRRKTQKTARAASVRKAWKSSSKTAANKRTAKKSAAEQKLGKRMSRAFSG